MEIWPTVERRRKDPGRENYTTTQAANTHDETWTRLQDLFHRFDMFLQECKEYDEKQRESSLQLTRQHESEGDEPTTTDNTQHDSESDKPTTTDESEGNKPITKTPTIAAAKAAVNGSKQGVC